MGNGFPLVCVPSILKQGKSLNGLLVSRLKIKLLFVVNPSVQDVYDYKSSIDIGFLTAFLCSTLI